MPISVLNEERLAFSLLTCGAVHGNLGTLILRLFMRPSPLDYCRGTQLVVCHLQYCFNVVQNVLMPLTESDSQANLVHLATSPSELR